MIKKLKIKFVTLTMVSLLVLLVVIVTSMNTVNYVSVVQEADATLDFIASNEGKFPTDMFRIGGHNIPGFTPESEFENRYFSVLVDSSYRLIEANISQVAEVDFDQAIDFTEDVLNVGKDSGFYSIYRYKVSKENGNTRITFLNCRKTLVSYFAFLYTSINVAVFGFLAVFVAVVILAGKITKPFAENYEKQKRFITDAGHEIKTPLTVINANVDLLEMEIGENESLSDIKQQTERLRDMTNDLIMLSRAEESGHSVTKIDFPLSDVAGEAVQPFRAIAYSRNITIQTDIKPMITLNGDEKSVSRLVTLLTDNALKYSPDGQTVGISLYQQGKFVIFTVENSTSSPIDSKDLDKIFDRFYRTDKSRNSEMGGHGIGLSVAKAIVTAHGGKISVSAPSEYKFRITVTLPAKTEKQKPDD